MYLFSVYKKLSETYKKNSFFQETFQTNKIISLQRIVSMVKYNLKN